ncbi:MAG: ABC transporter ATP-binding protein [Xanthobacteraceae bacterium]|nr:ABC transporter ATP-binding protein [Xanthobacteraceae bacterium]PWB63785.1 MAG: ABC transporter ATP-binding protein [Bradyrhizobiaceae bacterium]
MALILENVRRDAGAERHIRDVSLTLERGTLNVLLGPTLSGKTSLMRLMAGLDAPSEGRVLMDGRDLTGVPVQRRNVAMVYQQFINYPTLTVFENIASPLRVARLPATEIEARVSEAAALLRLEPYLGRLPLELSGGQQQRTAIARALVKRAELVLLDEPLANLDYKLREELREELPRIFAASGAIFVYATTEPSEALLLGGCTAALAQGRLTQFGPTPEVYRRPQDLTTARIFSDPPLNELACSKDGGLVVLDTGARHAVTGAFAGVPDGRYVVGFRAHHLFLEPPGPDAIALAATVSVAEITGSESFVHVDVRTPQGERRLVAQLPGVHRLEPTTALTVHLDPQRLFLFDAEGRLAAAPTIARAA